MATLVINRDSISVKLESNHLVIHEHADGGSFTRMPLVDVERVIVVGQPAISFRALAKFLDMGIPCSFVTKGGRWRGVMDGDSGFHARRRMRQYDKVGNMACAADLARRTVEAKISNARRTIQRFAAGRNLPLGENADFTALSRLKGELALSATLDSIRGIEGMAANVYFRLLAAFFPEDVPFLSRSRRPPRDEANALMSFVYTLLAGTFEAAARAHGLDVAAGFFHRSSDRAPALALDLMEPFRPAWADRLALDLLNHRRLRSGKHFEGSAEDGFLLNDKGRKIVFSAYGELMERRRDTPRGSMTCRQIVDDVVCRFISMVESDERLEFFKVA